MTRSPASVRWRRLPSMQQTQRPDFADPRLRLAYALMYVVGITLMVAGCTGALLWAPLLWCTAVGFVVIAVSFAVRAGRY